MLLLPFIPPQGSYDFSDDDRAARKSRKKGKDVICVVRSADVLRSGVLHRVCVRVEGGGKGKGALKPGDWAGDVDIGISTILKTNRRPAVAIYRIHYLVCIHRQVMSASAS